MNGVVEDDAVILRQRLLMQIKPTKLLKNEVAAVRLEEVVAQRPV